VKIAPGMYYLTCFITILFVKTSVCWHQLVCFFPIEYVSGHTVLPYNVHWFSNYLVLAVEHDPLYTELGLLVLIVVTFQLICSCCTYQHSPKAEMVMFENHIILQSRSDWMWIFSISMV
jgi:hypothetical protein